MIIERSVFRDKCKDLGRWVEVFEHNDHYHGRDHVTYIVRYGIDGSRYLSSNHRYEHTAVAHAKLLLSR